MRFQDRYNNLFETVPTPADYTATLTYGAQTLTMQSLATTGILHLYLSSADEATFLALKPSNNYATLTI